MIAERYRVGVIDYGMGNIASLIGSLNKIGLNSISTSDRRILDSVDLVILPGVGAFPAAMHELKSRKLNHYLIDKAKNNKPIIGICLGMQLLPNGSYEKEYTNGLNLIPGHFIPFEEEKTHIGWSPLRLIKENNLMNKSNKEYFYFNHSYFYKGNEEYIIAKSIFQNQFASIIGQKKVVGLQFHPEKSQLSGLILLKNLIYGMLNG